MAMRVHALSFSIFMLATPFAAADSPAELGKALFFDKRLSSDQTLSCASCHIPEKAFTNGKPTATGVHGQTGDRNVPSLINRAGTTRQFWDMRADSLESQAVMVLDNRAEMGGDLENAVKRLANDPKMNARFQEIFHEAPSPKNLGRALAAYEVTLTAGEAPYDRYVRGDLNALTPEQIRGKDLFFTAYKCASCHSGPNFSDEKSNVRCYPFTTNFVAAPIQRFKTPTLRNLIYTAPYMHNGALATLEEAVEFYNPSVQLRPDGKPDKSKPAVHIGPAEKKALVAFLKSLSAATPYTEKR